jgi:potassium-transporting ATPase KdpC subunit
MSLLTSPAVRQYAAALRTLLVLTVILGLAYPLAMTGIAQAPFHGNAEGSMLHRGNAPVGSSLIGQAFTRPAVVNGKKVLEPDPAYFQSRPSAAGTGYDPLATSASNLGPENKVLIDAIKARRTAVARLDGIAPAKVAPDALLASGSGLDPHISPLYARQQVRRVAAARGVSVARVAALVAAHTQGRVLGFLGEPRVNVLELNLALDALPRG